MNFYAYVQNNPINANDPYGRDTTIGIYRDTYTAKSVGGRFIAYNDKTGNYLYGYTLETAQNKAGLPPIDPGSYDAFIRTDHTPNRIELTGTGPRTNIQIHNANTPDQLQGCFAVGSNRSTDFVGNSVNTLNKLLDLIDEDNAGNIQVHVYKESDYPDAASLSNIGTTMGVTGASSNSTANFSDSAAEGGYLIYPNKPNTNMMRSVYSK